VDKTLVAPRISPYLTATLFKVLFIDGHLNRSSPANFPGIGPKYNVSDLEMLRMYLLDRRSTITADRLGLTDGLGIKDRELRIGMRRMGWD